VITTGNTILVTGAGTGMGLEAARQFSGRGNRVVMVARNAARLESEAARLENVSTFAADISDEGQVAELVEYLERSHPELNMILLNAGITHNYALFGDEDAFTHAAAEMNVNYLSTVRLTQRLEPLLGAKPAAAMIITTSGVAFAPDVQNPTYSATKAALHSLTPSMRLVLRRSGSTIQVFELMAPLVDSPFSEEVDSEAKMQPSEVIAALLASLEGDELEIRVGASEDIYQAMLGSPDGALVAVNSLTNS
jgi:uncharacterized oxidoreductase